MLAGKGFIQAGKRQRAIRAVEGATIRAGEGATAIVQRQIQNF